MIMDFIVHLEVGRLEDPDVCRDLVPGVDHHHVAEHDVAGVDEELLAVPDDQGLLGEQLVKLLSHLRLLLLLDEGEHAGDEDADNQGEAKHQVIHGNLGMEPGLDEKRVLRVLSIERQLCINILPVTSDRAVVDDLCKSLT